MQLAKSSLGTTLLGFSSISFALPLYLLLLSGFPTVDAFKVCTMIFAQIAAGAVIWLLISRPSQICVAEITGVGFAVGSVLTVIGHQLTLGRAFENVGFLFPIAVAVI